MGDTPPRPGILTCWKEIAAFFHRDVRTVQRWEREEGLPVHRHPHQRRSSVYAYPDELEAWWAQYQSSSGVGSALPESVAEAGDAEAEAEPGGLPVASLTPVRPAARTVTRWALAGVILCASVGVAADLLLRSNAAAGPGDYPLTDLAVVTTTGALEVRSLDDLNGDGRGDVVTSPILGNETLIYLGASGQATRTAPDVRIVSEAPGHVSGGSVGDVDGDGLADLVVSVYLSEPVSFSATGSSYLFRGRRDWPGTLRLRQDADVEFYVSLKSDIRMGACSSPNGVDLNGDGLRDVLLGGGDYSSSGLASAGGAFILFGRPDWPARMDVIAAADVTIHGSRTGAALRQHCSTGDFDADGRTDLALAASEDTLWNMLGGRARIYIFSGRGNWPRLIDAERDATLRVHGTSPGAAVSRPLLADTNGDQVDDLVVSLADPDRRGPGGRVAIVFGGRGRSGVLRDIDADVLVHGGATFGSAIATADVNIDGCSDVIVTEPETGSVHLLLGRHTSESSPAEKRIAPVLLASVGRGGGDQGIAIGDHDGDGVPDIALQVEGSAPGQRRLRRLTPSLAIGIDVRPGSSPNVLLPLGVLAVEVSAGSLSGELEADSLRLAGVAPTRLAWQDFDGDGRLNLRLYFDVSQLPVRADATRIGLRGRTRRGLPVSGSDDIVVVQESLTPRHDK